MSFADFARRVRRFFGNRGYTCDACEREIFEYPTKRLCADCKGALAKNDIYTCDKCGRKAVTAGVCLDCKSHEPVFSAGCSPFVYEGLVAALINRLKNGKRRLAFLLGEATAHCFLQTAQSRNGWDRYALHTENLLIVPVPSAKKRLRERGFNQAEEIAESFTEKLRESGFSAELGRDIMESRKDTAYQKKLSYSERKENVSGAYRVKRRAVCKDRTVVLIDDIMTTGATGNACSKLLFGAGAKAVIFVAVASLAERKRSNLPS